MPGENEIAARLHVSPPVVRRGLQELVSDGLITKRGGAATKVTRHSEAHVDGRPGRPMSRVSPAGTADKIVPMPGQHQIPLDQ